ncbi:MAG: helix-turn-helix domain-containing protein [Cyclobacteriaceae bacterium]
MKSILIITSVLSLAILLLSAVALYDTTGPAGFVENRAALVVRKIGHTLLLHAGDSTSRVMPVRQTDKATFELAFQSPFSFMPDTLVHIVRTQLASYNLPADYLVNVFDCSSHEVVYGFAIGPGQADILSCQGRVQPQGCYTIQIAFTDFDQAASPTRTYLLFTLALASLAAFVFVGKAWVKPPTTPPSEEQEQPISVGSYAFYPTQGVLKNNHDTISLSEKETKLLTIFAVKPNQLIERDRLLKEVWEDEGVFTGRSLDVFISKLRKKLQNDTSVRLTNVHGKGYVLEVDA